MSCIYRYIIAVIRVSLKASCWTSAGNPKFEKINAKRRSCTVPVGAFLFTLGYIAAT